MAGVYSFVHPGGQFEVHLRPGGRFYAPKFPTKSSWAVEGPTLNIDFGKYGKYALEQQADGTLSGSAVGAPDNWRKMAFVRAFAPAELALFDSVWDFAHPGGSFPVEFHADAYNHFVCKQFPAHSHWRLEGDMLSINWGKYGEYELRMAADGLSMDGCAKGQPTNWRKATRTGDIVHSGEDPHAHEHGH